jgi:hypothetical protein
MQNSVVDLGKFTVSIQYVLQEFMKRNTTFYSAEYGQIEFTVHTAKFILQFTPKASKVRLLYRHQEGLKYLDAHLIMSLKDPLADFVHTIEKCVAHARPFDGGQSDVGSI